MNYRFTFTVFTPTYNRANTIHRVYESLKNQTYRDFEWLIVDDGSTDNTCGLIAGWQENADFPIRYLYQPNQGKHIALNWGAQEAKGYFFLNFDSDDVCESNALERFKYHWDQILHSEKDNFSGVYCLCKTPEGKIIGSKYPFDCIDSDSLRIIYCHKVTGEKWGFNRTDVLKQFPFPTDLKNTYVPETIVRSAIARKYKTRYINECLRVYFTDSADSLVNQKIPNFNFKNTDGSVLHHKNILNYEIDFFWCHPLEFIRSVIHYGRFSLHMGLTPLNQFREIDTIIGKILLFTTFWIAFLVYCRDYLIHNISQRK